MNFGKNLHLRRLSKNLTQEELTEKLNVSRQTVSFSTIPDQLKRGETSPLLFYLWNCFILNFQIAFLKLHSDFCCFCHHYCLEINSREGCLFLCAWWRIYSSSRDSGRLASDTYILLHWDSSFWLLRYSKNNSILLKAVFLLHQLWELCHRKLPCRLPSGLACS